MKSAYDFCPNCGNRKVAVDEITKKSYYKIENETKSSTTKKSYNSLAIVGIGFALGLLTIVVSVSAMSGGGTNTEYIYIDSEQQYQPGFGGTHGDAGQQGAPIEMDLYFDPHNDDYYYDDPYYYDDYYYDDPYYYDDYYYDGGY